jgi:hypothetical protein
MMLRCAFEYRKYMNCDWGKTGLTKADFNENEPATKKEPNPSR